MGTRLVRGKHSFDLIEGLAQVGCFHAVMMPAADLAYDSEMEPMASEAAAELAPRKLTHEQARMEQRLYWSRKSIPERLAAMTALNRRMYEMRGISIDEFEANLTPRRVRRSKG